MLIKGESSNTWGIKMKHRSGLRFSFTYPLLGYGALRGQKKVNTEIVRKSVKNCKDNMSVAPSVLKLYAAVLLVFFCLTVTNSFPKGPLVCIKKDRCLRGVVLRDSVDGPYSAYLGIPFAKPPVGNLRFKNPQPADSWEGVYDASKDKKACIQKSTIPNSPVNGAEDCLYLNVFTPQNAYSPYSGPLPVMVYIHGGSYIVGSARLSELDPARIMTQRKVVVVTLQYRLGVLGFFSTGDRSASGNYGLKDQVMALRWVQNNIRAFGGDPRRVTIFGQSAGSACTQFHMLSPLSRGLFHRAISMSGSALAKFSAPVPNPQAVARAHGRILGIPDAATISTSELVQKLRTFNASTLLISTDGLKFWDYQSNVPYRPAVEPQDEPDAFLTEAPNTAWRRGKYTSVPWLTGTIPTDASFQTQAVYQNKSLIAEVDPLFPQLFQLSLQTEVSNMGFASLRRRFLKTTPPNMWLTETNYAEITKMLSEADFIYPMVKGVKQYLQNQNHAPTSVYSFQFNGRYSYSQVYTRTNTSYGLTHPDELIYLFRIPVFFPEFPPGSPEAEMCQIWVKFLVDFATKSNIAKEATCAGMNCNVVTFTNSNNTYFPVRKILVPGLDEDMYEFWKALFAE